jgi:hypothetical protein
MVFTPFNTRKRSRSGLVCTAISLPALTPALSSVSRSKAVRMSFDIGDVFVACFRYHAA